MQHQKTIQPHQLPYNRFFDKVDKNNQNGCWLWKAFVKKDGYGQFSWNNRPILAHRMSMLLAGYNLLGFIVDHQCRNRRCVNPKHLRLVDARTNTLENSVNFAAKNYAKTHCPNGHEYTKENTIAVKAPGRLPGRKCLICKRKREMIRYYNKKSNGGIHASF